MSFITNILVRFSLISIFYETVKLHDLFEISIVYFLSNYKYPTIYCGTILYITY